MPWDYSYVTAFILAQLISNCKQNKSEQSIFFIVHAMFMNAQASKFKKFQTTGSYER